jgi:hypothetical protein
MSASVGTLSDSLVKHRKAFAEFVTHETDEWQHSADAKRLYALFDQWNHQFFDGALVVPHILLSEPRSSRALGDTAHYSGWGSRLQIRLRPSLLLGTHALLRGGEEFKEGRFLFTADVLLHEMIHHYNDEIAHENEAGWHGHGPKFRDECNRSGRASGWARCAPRSGAARIRTCRAAPSGHTTSDRRSTISAPWPTRPRPSRRRPPCRRCVPPARKSPPWSTKLWRAFSSPAGLASRSATVVSWRPCGRSVKCSPLMGTRNEC